MAPSRISNIMQRIEYRVRSWGSVKQQHSKVSNTTQAIPELLARIQSLQEHGHFEELIATVNKALELLPNNVNLIICRGTALIALRRFDEALVDLANVLAVSPNDPDALNNWGVLLYAMGRLKDAQDAWDEAYARCPSHVIIQQNRDQFRAEMAIRNKKVGSEGVLP